MKAFLLAAGLGTRLQPLTNTVPKCVLPIDGKPMLYHWFELLKKHDVTDVLVNLHHLPEVVRNYVEDFKPSHLDLRIVLFHEKTLLYVRQCKSAPGDGRKMYHLSFVNHRDSRKVYHLAFQSDPPGRASPRMRGQPPDLIIPPMN